MNENMSEGGREYWAGALRLSDRAQRIYDVNAIVSPYEGSDCEITLFVYSYNDASSIIDTLQNVMEALDVVDLSYEIIIIDDASDDQTVELLQGFLAEFSSFSILLRTNKIHKGVADNYIDAAFIGRGKYFRVIYANNAEPVETMIDVLKATGDADIIVPYYVGSRFYGSGVKGSGHVFLWLFNLISGSSISRHSAAHIHLRYNVMRWHANTQGPAFENDLLYRLLEIGFTAKQAPCRAVNRNYIRPQRSSFWSNVHTLIDLVFRRLRNLF